MSRKIGFRVDRPEFKNYHSSTNMPDIPIVGWRARLISVIDDTGAHWKARGDCDTVIGEMRLLPSWEEGVVEFDEWGKLELDVFFRRANKESLARKMLSYKPGQLLLVSGKLNQRTYKTAQGFDHLNTKFEIDDAEIDFTNGEYSPLVAHLYTSDLSVFG